MNEPESQSAYPLSWPQGWPRHTAAQRQRAQFSRRVHSQGSSYAHKESLTVSGALGRLHSEVNAFTKNGKPWRINPDTMIVSTNIPVRRADGLPMSGRAEPEDVGVAVYFRFDGKPCVLACDKWDRVADNIAAIASHLDAMRGMERWGVGRLSQVFTGYAALPEPGKRHVGPWWNVLGTAHDAPFEKVREAYLSLVKKHHPDNGGDADEMAIINVAYEEAKKLFGIR